MDEGIFRAANGKVLRVIPIKFYTKTKKTDLHAV